MARGRPKGSKNRPKNGAASEGVGETDGRQAEAPRTNSDLTEDERHALHLRHCREYELGLAAKKKADAEFKNVGKRIKAEGDSVTKVKKTIQSRSPEGEAELRREIEETAEVLRWAGVAVGESRDLFPTNRTPAVDDAFFAGKRAGLDGQTASPPHAPSVPQYEAWMNGWRVGQDALMSAFAKKPAEPDEPPAAEFDPPDTSDAPFHAPPEPMPEAPAAPAG